ncbi:hypothetical protein JOD20_000707 [Herpetosiphon giganteus]|nr:hypothetical protein [Herpetosiphon giganteus]
MSNRPAFIIISNLLSLVIVVITRSLLCGRG